MYKGIYYLLSLSCFLIARLDSVNLRCEYQPVLAEAYDRFPGNEAFFAC